jgi:hypothetical protein
MGQLRSKSNGRRKPRTINLCADCFDSLPVYQLYDLFLQFGRDLDLDSATIFHYHRRPPDAADSGIATRRPKENSLEVNVSSKL